jgi:hypothetical protein
MYACMHTHTHRHKYILVTISIYLYLALGVVVGPVADCFNGVWRCIICDFSAVAGNAYSAGRADKDYFEPVPRCRFHDVDCMIHNFKSLYMCVCVCVCVCMCVCVLCVCTCATDVDFVDLVCCRARVLDNAYKVEDTARPPARRIHACRVCDVTECQFDPRATLKCGIGVAHQDPHSGTSHKSAPWYICYVKPI